MSQFALVIAQLSVHLYKLDNKQANYIASADASVTADAWLEKHLPKKAFCTLVSDIMDESYIQSSLPPIWMPSTRQQLVQRRLTQQLRDTPYRAAALIPSSSYRPPVRASLIGLGQTERISDWVSALTAHEVRIKGLWPMSALIALAVNAKVTRRVRPGITNAPANTRPYLVLVATPAGLRQVLVRGGLPLFSRLAIGSSPDSLSAGNVLLEARRTVQYLIGQDWLTTAEQPIATQMWLPLEDDAELVAAANDAALDVQSITAYADAYASLLPLLTKAPAQLQFLPESFRLSWRAAQIASASTIVGITAVVLAALWSADLLWESINKRTLARQQLATAATIDKRARQEVLQAKGDLSQAGLAVASVQVWQKLIAKQPDQIAAMQHLASALKLAPGIGVEKITWTLPTLPIEAAGAPPAAPAPFECPKSAGAAPAAEPAGGAEAAKPAVALVSFTAVLPDDIAPRQALEFQASTLAKLNSAGWTAFIIKSTVTLEPTQEQTGTVGKPNPRGFEMCMQKADV